jgi:hypothetical protein
MVSTRDSERTSRALALHHPKRRCLLNTRNVLPVGEVAERYQVSLSSHGTVVGFLRSWFCALEVDQGVERMYSLRRFGSREGVQAVTHIQ